MTEEELVPELKQKVKDINELLQHEACKNLCISFESGYAMPTTDGQFGYKTLNVEILKTL